MPPSPVTPAPAGSHGTRSTGGWPDRRILDLFGIDVPILLAPMAGAGTPALAIAVSSAGGLGALPGAQYTPAELRQALQEVRGNTLRPVNVNFFCHRPPVPDEERALAWRARLLPYYRELGLDAGLPQPAGGRAPFDDAYCTVVEEMRPAVVSFHFGLPEQVLLDRVKATGARVISSATTVEEARWLEERGCDAIIAMGLEAGGHRGSFLTGDMAGQIGTFALVPQVADAVRVPVIAAGGVADGRGIAAALLLGASAVQMGTCFLFCPESKISALHRAALAKASAADTRLTNLFTGRPARGIENRLMREQGPLRDDLPPFPLAAAPLGPLRAKAEAGGRSDFSPLWSGQAARLSAPLARDVPAGEVVARLAVDALARLAP